MIQFAPLIASAVQSIFYKKAEEAVTEYGAGVFRVKTKREPRVKLEGKKTYIGIAVLLASALAPQLGISEGEVTTIITALGTAAGVIMAIYGRLKANK
jgi:small-conductance mechanosensitive channel